MRPSTIGNRSSYAPGVSSQANSAANLAKLLEKKKEYEGVAALDKASTAFLERITGLMEDADVMANAGEGVNHVLFLCLPVNLIENPKLYSTGTGT
jgi:DASH complex subunit DAD2